MLMRYALLLLLPFHTLLSSIIENEEELWKEAPAPAWTAPIDVPLNLDKRGSHLQFLLLDFQRFCPQHTEYFHMAVRPLSQTGVEAIAQLEIDFEPTFQKLHVHEIKVYRNGMWIDKKNSRHELLQREENLEENLVSGELTVVYFLEDIRPGDIIEYSYSTIGDNPLFSAHYFDRMSLEIGFIVEKISHRLLTYPEHKFTIKQFNTDVEPVITDLSQEIREWRWELEDPDYGADEDDQPDWFHPEAFLLTSDYKHWGEVADEIAPHFTLPEDFEESVPDEMATLVASWKGSDLDRALAALRFVQDEIRYLGFEEGIMGHKPHDPRKIFQQRFGDCKDKTFLLKALLHLMRISSTPIMVDTSEGKWLPQSLPLPYAFNHVILMITIDGTNYWVDPTICFQGGALAGNFFPNYYWGLPLAKGAGTLMQLPEHTLERPTEIETHVKIISENEAELTIIWNAYGAKADGYRNYVQQIGLLNLSEESLNKLQKKYGNVTRKSSMSMKDDRNQNVFTLTESYFLPLRQKGSKSTLNVSSIVVGHFLDSDFNPNRSTPYLLLYPLWVREHIRIDNPFGHCEEREEECDFDFSTIHYHFNSIIENKHADFFHELRHTDDYIPPDEILKYWDAVQEIEPLGSFDFKIK